MTEKITLEQALELVSFIKRSGYDWKVLTVYDDVHGDIRGGVHGDVNGDVHGTVRGTIDGHRWESIETPQERLERLIQESGDQELIEAFNQLQEDNFS